MITGKRIAIGTGIVCGYIIYKGGGANLAHFITHLISQLGLFVNNL